MAFWGNGAIVEAQKVRIKELEDDRDRLYQQVISLQEAILARAAPDMPSRRYAAENPPPDAKLLEKERDIQDLMARFVSELEQDQYIRSQEDLHMLLTNVAGMPQPQALVPGNDES
jgi:hypothetical protein